MKKLFGMIAIVLFFSSIGYGKTTVIDSEKIMYTTVYELCTGGYKFVMVREYENKTGIALSIVQVLDRDGKPETCVHEY